MKPFKPHYTPTYQSWQAMRQRCLNPNHPHFHNYGGKGIAICDRWNSFQNFKADMGERPAACSIDRIDSSKGYTPSNCRWATRTEQNRNNSQNKLIVYKGDTKCLSAWCELFGLRYHTIYARLYKLNWNVEDAFEI